MAEAKKRLESHAGAGTTGTQGATRLWRRPFVVGVVVVIGLALAATVLFPRSQPATAQGCTGAATGLAPGQCAPAFTLTSLDGQRVSLSRFRGKPVLLHFWAVGCTTCAGEYADFSRAVRQYGEKGLAVLAVDAWGEQATLVRHWQDAHHLPATILIDPPIAVFNRYNGQGTPTTYFIDRAGRIVASNAGPLSYAEFQRNIAAIL